MKIKTARSFFLFSFAIAGFVLLSASSYAQEKSGDQTGAKKTITIHITKEVDGNKVVIDTTIVTNGDFDVDAFLEEKGVMKGVPDEDLQVERDIVIRHPGDEKYNRNDFDENMPDTIKLGDDQEIVFNHRFDRPFRHQPHAGMPFEFNFKMPEDFPQMRGPQFEGMFEDMLRSFGLDDVMPFGDMKQIVVKKKHNGKKMIITFEDRDGVHSESGHGNKHDNKVIIHKNGGQGMAPHNEERVIIRRNPGERVIINEDTDTTAPVKQEKKVVIIKEEKAK